MTLYEAAQWYEEQQSGLSSDFIQTILFAIGSLADNPLKTQLRDRLRNIRWIRSFRFPYRVVYQISGNTVTVIAVLHSARLDSHWKRRA